MARTRNPAPHGARSAADTAMIPAPAPPFAPAAAHSPAAAVLAALSAEPVGATVAVIAGHAGVSTAAARQALIAHEKNGTATRVKGSRPGIADTWKPAAPDAPGDEAAPAESPARAAPPTPGSPPPRPPVWPTPASPPRPPTAAPPGTSNRKRATRRGRTRPSPPRPPGTSWPSPRPPMRLARPSRPGTWTSPWLPRGGG